MRVMVVTDQYEPMVGGVPTVTRELARGLADRGHDVALVAPSPGWRGRRTTAGQVSVTFRGSLRWPWYDDMRLGCLPTPAARKLVASFAPDVAHIHSPVTLGVMARIGASRRQVPVVYTNHYMPANVRPSTAPRARIVDDLFYRHVVGFSNRCSYVTAPTATALRLLRERGLRVPSGVVSNGVDLRAYSPGPADDRIRQRYGLPAGRPLILSVGQTQPRETRGRLLDAAARLEPGNPGTLLALAGTGPDEGRLRDQVHRLGVAGRVRFLGFVPGYRPAGPVPAGGRVRDRVRGRAAVPGHHGGDGERAAGGRRQRGRARRAGAPRARTASWPARDGRPTSRAASTCSAATRAAGRMSKAACGSSPTTTGIACSPGGNPFTARCAPRGQQNTRR